MRFETVDGKTDVFLEDGEETQAVLRAIVRASFELARPAGLGHLHFKDESKLTDEDADRFINIPPKMGSAVVYMDYVEGRQCKTILF